MLSLKQCPATSQQELRYLDMAIRRAQQRQRRARRKAEAWNLTERMKLVSLSVYVQSHFSQPAALTYMMLHRLKGIKRKQGFDEEVERLCETCPIREWFREASVDLLEQIGLNPSTKKDVSIFSEAHRFLSEKRTMAWLQSQNNSEGRVVTAVELADCFFAYLHGDADSMSAKAKSTGHLQDYHFEQKVGKRGLKLTSGIRKWCASFKRRWNVRHGQMKERECLDTEDIQQKAGTLLSRGGLPRLCFLSTTFESLLQINPLKSSSRFNPRFVSRAALLQILFK